MAELRRFMRANPQVLVLLIVCLVLGIGTFLLVIFGLVSSGSDTTNGEPSGWIAPAPRLVAQALPTQALATHALPTQALAAAPARPVVRAAA